MIQDIYPHTLDNQYKLNVVPAEEDFVLLYQGRSVLVRLGQRIELPTVKEFGAKELTYLFSVDGVRFFLPKESCMSPEQEAALLELGYQMSDLKDLREAKNGPKELLYAVYTGKHLADWYRDTKFCGRCGEPMAHSEKERAMVCPKCGYTAYPRIMPAVIVGVINKDRILITRYRVGYNHNALIAGFVEIGETVEETVAREVMEEAGIRVKNIRYYKSQPWGIANDILLGYYCEVDGDDTIRMDSEELKYAEWVRPEDIVLQPDSSSLTNEMMQKFKNEGNSSTWNA